MLQMVSSVLKDPKRPINVSSQRKVEKAFSLEGLPQVRRDQRIKKREPEARAEERVRKRKDPGYADKVLKQRVVERVHLLADGFPTPPPTPVPPPRPTH